ncbi:Solute carrier family 25 member 35 [Operophtera brumata]|uniref:Solute carrier family 25 member 35 n=1 Tax=Operophtera brumata TaxID=104452 RepID=A0A0L7LA07_OPEBR|nr:Solute carrier family 25 member 35 [Operophtera brumata]
MDFVVGGMAGVGAGFFSNPFDVIKTRMQLQGELRAKGHDAVYYKNIPHAIFTIVKHDGVGALQKGLVPALWFQLVVNGVRLGIYQHADNYGLLRDEHGNTMFFNSLLFGSISGMCGAFFGSPLQLVKTQLMSYSSEKIAVGTQHAHRGLLYAISKIYTRNGLSGLWRGAHGMMMRNSIGSASQIASFAITKTEGLLAFYKGIGPSYLRQAPHTILLLVFWDMLKDAQKVIEQKDGVRRDLTDLAMGGVSAMFATIFTNPIEVVKTRLQLQGELKSKGSHTVFYKNVPHGLFVIARTEGVVALQRGLPAMMGFQFFLNTFRLGVYRITERRGLTTDASGRTSLVKGAAAAGLGGALGSIAGTPFFLVKTRLQAQAARVIAVGHQHKHGGTISALGDIYKREGVKGLFRGVYPQVPRGAVGSSSQILSFTFAKEQLRERGLFANKPLALSFVGANLGGVVMTLCLNPFDVVATRLSNQHAQNRGTLYSGMVDCFLKMVRSEGVASLYKGVGANYMRLGPHTVLLLVCWDQLKILEEYLRR